jgi:hypothetical protein
MKWFLFFAALIFPVLPGTAQSLKVSGKITDAALPGIREFQFYANGRSKKLPVSKDAGTFEGELNIKSAQFFADRIAQTKAGASGREKKDRPDNLIVQ